MRIVSAALAAFLLLAMSARAYAADISLITAQDVAAIATEAGATEVAIAELDGTSFINFKMGGQPYSYSVRLCSKNDRTKCGGVLMAMGARTGGPIALETVNKFNTAVPFLTAVKLSDDLLGFGRFAVTLGGVTRDNIKANMEFLTLAPQLFTEVNRDVVASVGADGKPVAGVAPAKLEPVKLTPEQAARMIDEALIAKVRQPK